MASGNVCMFQHAWMGCHVATSATRLPSKAALVLITSHCSSTSQHPLNNLCVWQRPGYLLLQEKEVLAGRLSTTLAQAVSPRTNTTLSATQHGETLLKSHKNENAHHPNHILPSTLHLVGTCCATRVAWHHSIRGGGGGPSMNEAANAYTGPSRFMVSMYLNSTRAST